MWELIAEVRRTARDRGLRHIGGCELEVNPGLLPRRVPQEGYDDMELDLEQLPAAAKENLRQDGFLPPMLLVKTEAAREWLLLGVEVWGGKTPSVSGGIISPSA